MTTSKQVQSWINWTRNNMNVSEGFPRLTSVAIIGHPWKDEPRDIGSFVDETYRDDSLAEFADLLTPDPGEFATRFTALHYYFTLFSRLNIEIANPVLYGWDNESEAESLSKALSEDLELLIRFLPVERCPGNWQFIRWEILNSCLVRDWERAKDLYDWAEKLELLERSELQALRGQFRFLKVYFSAISQGDDAGLDSLQWEPAVYGSVSKTLNRHVVEVIPDVLQGYSDKLNALTPDQQEELIREVYRFLNNLRMFRFGMTVSDTDLKVGERDQEWLEYASVDLKGALENKLDFPSSYRSILARSYFLTGHFQDAAKQYERLIELDPGSSVNKVYESLALSYRRAGEPQKAIECLQKCPQRYADVHKNIADIQAQEGHYFEACESLRRDAEINPQTDMDLGTKIALALGGIVESHQDPSVYARRFVESNTETSQLTDSLLRTNWGAFGHLKEEAQRKWIYASITLHTSSGQGPLHLTRVHDAAALFAEATEIQLREEVFKRFREHATSKQGLKELLSREMTGKREENFYKFLLGRTFLALGDMCRVLELSANPRDEILREFNRWLPKKLAPLAHHNSIQIRHLREICQYRNAVRHEGKLTGNPALIHSWCREIVDLIV